LTATTVLNGAWSSKGDIDVLESHTVENFTARDPINGEMGEYEYASISPRFVGRSRTCTVP
jgi:hypothetical protein